MDVLSDWLRDVGTQGILLARSKFAAPWGIAIPPAGQDHGGDCMFHVVTEGSCWLRWKDSCIQLSAGDYVLLPNGDAHDLLHDPRAKAERLEDFLARSKRIPKRQAEGAILCGAYRSREHAKPLPLIRSLPGVIHFPASEIQTDGALGAVLQLLRDEVENPGPGGEALLPTLFDALLLYTLRAWGKRNCSTTQNRWMAALRDPGVAAALQKMHADPARAWTVESLAKTAGVSRAVFAKRFCESLGEPPLSYLTEWRMRLAARRFVSGNGESMSEVARQCGYDSEFAFSRAFKRVWGVSPREYRKRETIQPPAARRSARTS